MDEQPEIIPQVVAEHGASQRPRHQFFLALAAMIVALAWALEVRADERVAFRGFSQWPLPHSCYSRAVFGVPCPGCGLTRSFIYLARGDWHAAWQEHRLGWLLAGIVALQFPYRLWALARGGRVALSPQLATALALALMCLMFVNWGIGLIAGP
ncbi:MAG TPA: DUF2752 domain-containing protein [Pirellulales bacterium]|nr:DUF2752 domain-containing protein [Pirellulales bacterium]